MQFLIADISCNIACKELNIAQIAQINQFFQLLHLVHIYGHGFYEFSRMLSIEYSREEIVKQTPNQSPIFAIFVEYSGEKNMADVIIFGYTVGRHRISNEVRRNKSLALAALLLTS